MVSTNISYCIQSPNLALTKVIKNFKHIELLLIKKLLPLFQTRILLRQRQIPPSNSFNCSNCCNDQGACKQNIFCINLLWSYCSYFAPIRSHDYENADYEWPRFQVMYRYYPVSPVYRNQFLKSYFWIALSIKNLALQCRLSSCPSIRPKCVKAYMMRAQCKLNIAVIQLVAIEIKVHSAGS